VSPDITQSGCSEKRITDSMDEYIGIGMTGSAFVVRDPDSAKPEFMADFQFVRIKSETNTEHS
jgi:hypothetical protein